MIAPLYAQDAPPVTLAGTQQYDVRAAANGHTYRLYVAPPPGYVQGDTTRYPVLYVLDGHFAFPAAVAAREYMGLFKELEDVIIVGVAEKEYSCSSWFIDRRRDYTPSKDPASDSAFAKQYNLPVKTVRSGGGHEFLDVLRKDVIPLIDKAYRTTGDRGLTGHSPAHDSRHRLHGR